MRPPGAVLGARRHPAYEEVRVLRDRQPDAPPVLPPDLDLYP